MGQRIRFALLVLASGLAAWLPAPPAYAVCTQPSNPSDVGVAGGNTKASVYWSSSNLVLIARDTVSVAGAPAEGQDYTVAQALPGGGTVQFMGTAAGQTSFHDTGLTNNPATPYYYKAFAKTGSGATACYSSGIQVNVRPTTTSLWSYMLDGGPIMNPGIAGTGAIYTSSNGTRIASFDTVTGARSWQSLATSGAVQGWLTWLPVGNTGFKSLQSGSVAVNDGSASKTVSLTTTVDASKAFVVCSLRTSSSTQMNQTATCELNAGGTQVIVSPGATTSAVEAVQWYVVEFWGGVTVQRGLSTVTSGATWMVTLNQSTITDLSKSFIVSSARTAINATGSSDRWMTQLRLITDTDTQRKIEFFRGNTSSDALNIAWQVVQMDAAFVQRGTATIAATTSSIGPITLPTRPVDPKKSFLRVSEYSKISQAGKWRTRGELAADGKSVTFYVQVAVTGTAAGFAWEVVELSDGTTVQSGTTSASGTTTTMSSTGLSTIDTTRAIPFFSASGGAGSSSSDNPNTTWLATFPTTTSIQFQRTNSVSLASTSAWFIVQFPNRGGVIGGDQSGKVYAVNASTGGQSWMQDLGAANPVQAAVSAQVRSWSNTDFQNQYSTDVIFAATRKSTTTDNKVYALNASTGAVLWTFDPVNLIPSKPMDYVVGQPWVDYIRNRLYVASCDGAGGCTGGSQNTLWVINTLDGSLVAQFALGGMETSPTVNYSATVSLNARTLWVGNKAGNLYAIDLGDPETLPFATPALKWTSPAALGSAIKGFVWEDWTTSGRLYFSTADGNALCLNDPGVGQAGPGVPPAAPQASCPWKRLVYTNGVSTPLLLGKLYVGADDGKIYEINLTTGANVGTPFTVGDGTSKVGAASSEDGTQVFVGTEAGKLYRVPVPF